mgnify:FL=1
MIDLIIRKINESVVELDCDDDIHHNIYLKYSEYMARLSIFTSLSYSSLG